MCYDRPWCGWHNVEVERGPERVEGKLRGDVESEE